MKNIKVISFNPRMVDAGLDRIPPLTIYQTQEDNLGPRFMQSFGRLVIIANMDLIIQHVGILVADEQLKRAIEFYGFQKVEEEAPVEEPVTDPEPEPEADPEPEPEPESKPEPAPEPEIPSDDLLFGNDAVEEKAPVVEETPKPAKKAAKKTRKPRKTKAAKKGK